MGMIGTFLNALFGGGRNVVAETAGVFRENAEAGAGRAVALRDQALTQFAAEFARAEKGAFDRFMDGLNRVPRPAMALGVIGLLIAAMFDPVWFATRMQGLVLVPQVVENLELLEQAGAGAFSEATGDRNPALEDWRRSR